MSSQRARPRRGAPPGALDPAAAFALNVLEVNPRHSQSHAELFGYVDGAANHEAMVHLALGRDPSMPCREGLYRVAAKWFLRHWSDGVVRRHPTNEEVAAVERELDGVTIDVIAHEGDRLSKLIGQDSYSYTIANIYIGADDEQHLIAKFERCAEALPFEFDDALRDWKCKLVAGRNGTSARSHPRRRS